MISLAPVLEGGVRHYIIVFSSNAPDPKLFNGAKGTLGDDANSEIWIYRVPAVADVDLTLGAEIPRNDLAIGQFVPITATNASRLPTPGGIGEDGLSKAPTFADDNREPSITDDGSLIAFVSTRNPCGGNGNADSNPEIFFYNIVTAACTQGTNTQTPTPDPGFGQIFNSNPNLSGNGSVVAFLSSANLATNNADLNAEIFVANVSGGALSNIRQVTRTQNGNGNTNVWSFGRRLSRDGALLAFESRATDPKSGAAATSFFLGTFVYTISSDTFVEIGNRPTSFTDIGHFPTFTDYNSSLSPSSLVFASALNFKPDGTFPPLAEDATGLNPNRAPQIFLTAIPASTTNTFVRLTNTPLGPPLRGTNYAVSETRKRLAFLIDGVEFGGGNTDLSRELFYNLSPQVTASSAAVLSFFTGLSAMPVAAATPVPSPTPTPTPTPSPVPGQPFGVAPGEVTQVRSTVALAPSTVQGAGGDETTRSPALPIELNGVSVSVDGYAAGLYFVGKDEKQINFVVPIAVPQGLRNVVVNVLDAGANTDTIFRGLIQLIGAQPDIFTTATDGIGGRAGALNVTNPMTPSAEPFNVTSTDSTGATVPTVIELSVTGVRNVLPSEVTVTVGTTAITGGAIVAVRPNLKMPGFDSILFALPASLAGAGDVPVVVTVSKNGVTTTSRPADTAPHITIN
jgi:uncharacterized protein (TIGR03437 family)